MYLEVQGLKKCFGNKNIVDDLSFSLDKGKLMCILGSSGCGKTTTLNMIGGFLKADGGRILLDGQDITDISPEERPVTTVFQAYALFPHMSVMQNVVYGLKFKKVPKQEAEERGRRYLEMVGLAEYADRPIQSLSGGQQQRVALARALITEPKLCLLDEPFSNLDAGLREKLRFELKRLQKELGMTMLSTESYQNSLYYWPSPNADLTPSDSNPQYKYNTMYQDENGEWHIKDRVMEAKEAAERYGLHFGTYLSPQCPQTDIQGLVERYDPWYIFVDGNPQTGVNLDIAFSSARNYNDRVLFNTNPNKEVSDQDLTLMERPFWYSQPYVEGGNWEDNINATGKYVVHEEWNDPYSTALDLWRVWAPGGDQMRDSWPDAMKELIDAVGHGYVMNHDLSIAASRGLDNLNWSGAIRTSMDKDNIYMMIPVDSQQMSDMRKSMADWLENDGGPELYESLFGTMPYLAAACIMRSVSSTVKKPWSQKTSTYSASPSRATAGSISRQMRSTYSAWRPT